MKVGDWGFITGVWCVSEEMFKNAYPQNIFGKVIKENKSYSRTTGKLLVIDYTIRVYRKMGRFHYTTTPKYFKQL